MLSLSVGRGKINAPRYWELRDDACSAFETSGNTSRFPHPYRTMNFHVRSGNYGMILMANSCTEWREIFKGTQEWDFFWLPFWNLYYFIVSYVKILKFCNKKLFDWASIGGGTIFPRRLRGMKNFFELGQKIFFFIFLLMNPLYELILVFPKFDPLTAPGMALCVNLGPKCQNLFCLVWD